MRWRWTDTAIVGVASTISFGLFAAYMYFTSLTPPVEPWPTFVQTQYIENYCGCLDRHVGRAAIYFENHSYQEAYISAQLRLRTSSVDSVIQNTSWGDCGEAPMCGYSSIPFHIVGAWRTEPELALLEWTPVESRWALWTCTEDIGKASVCDQLIRKPPLEGTIDEVVIFREVPEQKYWWQKSWRDSGPDSSMWQDTQTASSPTSERFHKILGDEGMQMHLGQP